MSLRDDVAALVERWDAHHADWCCTKGCTWPNDQHIAVDPGALVPTGSEPCPGVCTCDVGNYVAPLRRLLEEHP